jgi:amino acid transporter/menaquinone-dependent protoporphyrinogen IX oxidase
VSRGRGPYHPKTASRTASSKQLGLADATAMGVGGMIGGGIFSVLGVAIALAGNLAFACFVLGAILAGATAWSYAGVTARTGTSGGPFVQLRRRGHAELAAWLLWLLVFGYMVAMAVYSFTFGRYAASALGFDADGARLLSVLVIAAFLGVNLRGVRLSALTEDVVVLSKLLLMASIAAVGLAHLSSARLSPLASNGPGGLFVGAATVFFAYEGFELISYDRDDTRSPERTVPRALLLSVVIVAIVYVAVTLGAQMLVGNRAIMADKEVAFVTVGRAALGEPGRWLAIGGALLATGSAINATLFSAARLVRDASADHVLPRRLGREQRGVPFAALAFIAVTGGAMAMLSGITVIIAVGSGAFLAVYTLVNLLQARGARSRAERAIAGAAAAGSIAAIGVLVVDLAATDLIGFGVLAVLVVVVTLSRGALRRGRRLAGGPSPLAARSAGRHDGAMTKILMVFHTSEGQTAKIAERVATVLRDDAFDVEVHDVGDAPGPEGFDGVVVGDSIHVGRHSRQLRHYLAEHRVALEPVPTALFQVSMTSAHSDAEHTATAQKLVHDLVEGTSCDPDLVGLFAGALVYTQYGWMKRRIMRSIARKEGNDTDTTRDHEYTDWEAVEQFARDVGALVRASRETAPDVPEHLAR